MVQGQSSNRGLGQSPAADKLKFLAYVHIIFYILPMQDFFAGQRGAWLKWPSGKYANAPWPIHSSLLPLHLFDFEILDCLIKLGKLVAHSGSQ